MKIKNQPNIETVKLPPGIRLMGKNTGWRLGGNTPNSGILHLVHKAIDVIVNPDENAPQLMMLENMYQVWCLVQEREARLPAEGLRIRCYLQLEISENPHWGLSFGTKGCQTASVFQRVEKFCTGSSGKPISKTSIWGLWGWPDLQRILMMLRLLLTPWWKRVRMHWPHYLQTSVQQPSLTLGWPGLQCMRDSELQVVDLEALLPFPVKNVIDNT